MTVSADEQRLREESALIDLEVEIKRALRRGEEITADNLRNALALLRVREQEAGEATKQSDGLYAAFMSTQAERDAAVREAAELRALLRPFAEVGVLLDDNPDHNIFGISGSDGSATVTAGDFQRARAALEATDA